MIAGQSLLEVARQAVAAEVPVVRELGNALVCQPAVGHIDSCGRSRHPSR